MLVFSWYGSFVYYIFLSPGIDLTWLHQTVEQQLMIDLNHMLMKILMKLLFVYFVYCINYLKTACMN